MLDTAFFACIERDLVVLEWMVGLNLAMTVAVLWEVFSTYMSGTPR